MRWAEGFIAVDWGTTNRRAWLRRCVNDQLATTQDIVRAMPGLLGDEMRLAAATVRQWVHRGKLTQHPAHPHDTHHRPRYRVGDVIDLVIASHDKRTKAG